MIKPHSNQSHAEQIDQQYLLHSSPFHPRGFFIKVKTKGPTLMQKYQLKRAEIKGEEDSATNNQHCLLQQTSPLQTGTKHEPQDRACWETHLQMKELSHSP